MLFRSSWPSPGPPLPSHSAQTSYKRSSGPLSIFPPPLPLHPPQTSYKCSSGLSVHLALLLDLPCLRIQPRRATRAHLASPSILPFSWTSPAFAFSPDELQELVWALYSSLHCPCLRIQPRRATSARLGFVFFFLFTTQGPRGRMRGLESRAPGILLFYYFISFIFHITNCFVLGTEYAYHHQQQHRQHPHHHHHHKGPNR